MFEGLQREKVSAEKVEDLETTERERKFSEDRVKELQLKANPSRAAELKPAIDGFSRKLAEATAKIELLLK